MRAPTKSQVILAALCLAAATIDFVGRVLVLPDQHSRRTDMALPVVAAPPRQPDVIFADVERLLPSEVSKTPAELTILLRGVISNRGDVVAFAQTDASGKEAVRKLRVGDTFSGWTVEGASLEQVTLQRNGEIRVLKIVTASAAEDKK